MADKDQNGKDAEQKQEGKEQVRADEEWKKQVAEEKERLREQEKAAAGGGQGAKPGEMPEANFQVFLAGLYTQTLMALGQMENPVTGKKSASLPEARYLIDTIEVLREKTKGNLDEQEAKYMENLLYDLQMRYVDEAKNKDDDGQQSEEQSDSEGN